ncbi:uncharacterized protein LOC119455469 [Dermacentor silvarum]|uniref:uncharacterized protein LOC119455469 n=1 Tax=Dermacentor silvarum TaxID=543639 RepID=UPI0021014A7E|nr:uncharacterized protein LOC119455469 [Dermacentor silvarum]
MSEVTWFGPALALLMGLLAIPAVQAQYVQLYGAGPEPYPRNLQRSLPSMSGAELQNLLQWLLRDAALLRKRSPDNGDGQDAIPPGFVGARGRRQDGVQEQPPGFVGARGKRGSELPLLLAGLADAGGEAPRAQVDRPLGSQ